MQHQWFKRLDAVVKAAPNNTGDYNQRTFIHFLHDNYTQCLNDVENAMYCGPFARHSCRLETPLPAVLTYQNPFSLGPLRPSSPQSLRQLPSD